MRTTFDAFRPSGSQRTFVVDFNGRRTITKNFEVEVGVDWSTTSPHGSQRRVARKTATTADGRRQLEREVEIGAVLTSELNPYPGEIAELLGFRETGTARPFLVNTSRGVSLAELHRSGLFPLEKEAEWRPLVISLVRALRMFEVANVVHRDLTPSNILYDQHAGSVHVIDFGISRPFGSERDGEGTRAWMSPQQSHGVGTVSTWDDVYSAGLVIWHVCTQRTPRLGRRPDLDAVTDRKLRQILEDMLASDEELRPLPLDLLEHFGEPDPTPGDPGTMRDSSFRASQEFQRIMNDKAGASLAGGGFGDRVSVVLFVVLAVVIGLIAMVAL